MSDYYTTIPGWFDYPDLYTDAVKSAPANSHLVEVGCFMGKSAAYMLEEIKNAGKPLRFSMVDIWKLDAVTGAPWKSELCPDVDEWIAKYGGDGFYNQVRFNMAQSPAAAYLTEMIQSDSVAAAKRFADESVYFCFIDACHHFVNVKADLAAWWPKIKIGGAMAGHDWSDGGVKDAVSAFCGYHGFTHLIVRENSWIINKSRFSVT